MIIIILIHYVEQMKQYRYGFTLVEMLIVIVIIGILAAALIPKITSMQARARDTARTADMRNVSTALESYKLDHNSYPIAIYAFVKPAVSLSTLLLPTTFAQTAGSSLDSISSSLSSYMTSLPKDPKGTGISSSSAGECITAGSSYAYYTDPSGSLYAITSTKESKKGNASACGDTIDKNNDGNFQKVGQGLNIDISAPPTDASCFTFSAGIISDYNSSCPKDVVIPNQINGQTVTRIGNYAFRFKELTSVIIPNSVTIIGDDAFWNNNITSLTLPNSVTSIGVSAFSDNNLTSLVIPNSVTSIGVSAFSRNKLTSLVIPNSVTSIGRYAFSYNKLTSLTLSNSLSYIDEYVFSYNHLFSLNIPSSITSIHPYAFSRNGTTYMDALASNLFCSSNPTCPGSWILNGALYQKQ